MEPDGRMWTLSQTMVWVCNAMGDFATPDEINTVIDAFEYLAPKRERTMFEGFMRMQTLPSVRPGGADVWLRSEIGETVEHNVENERLLTTHWGNANEAILAAARNGSLPLFGRPRDGSRVEAISRLDCQRLEFKEGEAPYAEYAHDPIYSKHARAPLPSWDTIRIEASKVIELWPHPDAARRTAGDEMPRTGAPGRPSSMHLVLNEARRRRETGKAALTVSQEALALLDWFKSAHPGHPPPGAKTIENRIRDDHRAWRKT